MPLSQLKFLVVEDHDFQRAAIVQLLQNLGAKAVHSADDGASALRVVTDPDRPLDIVICDLSMPGMDGMEFIRHLSESAPGLSLILSSALESSLVASVAHMAQAYGVHLLGAMSKPSTAVKLAPLIEIYRLHTLASGVSQDVAGEFDPQEIAQAWNNEDFQCFLEPRVNMQTQALLAARGAAYWRHPQLGMLPAQRFRAALQAQGLGDDLAWLVLRKAAAHGAALHRRGQPLKVVVSLTLPSLTDADLALRVQQTVAGEHFDPHFMVLGIAESSLDIDVAKALENLARLRVAGFGLMIEDFGTGRMAQEQLAHIAFTELSLHRSLIARARLDESARVGLAVGLDMARDLGLLSVADGVDSKEDWAFLGEWGCNACQGAFVGAPMPLEGFVEWADQRMPVHQGQMK